MFWDVSIAVLLGVLAAVTSGLAGQLAATKTWQKRLFWGSGALMVLLIAVQGYRNAGTQSALEAELRKIQKNTETPPTVHVEVPPSTVIAPKEKAFVDFDHAEATWNQKESTLIVNGYTKNKSSIPAWNVDAIFTVPLAAGVKGFPSKKLEAELYADFEKAAGRRIALRKYRSTLGPGESVWGTVTYPGFNNVTNGGPD